MHYVLNDGTFKEVQGDQNTNNHLIIISHRHTNLMQQDI